MIDIDGSELAKAPDCYDKLEGDVTSGTCGDDNSYDLVFSAMLAEHVKSGEALHRNLFRILAPGGVAIHYFPTMCCPPFVANYFLPERLATRCLNLFNPRDRFQNAKFPAHYSWCRGPSAGQLARLREIGYEVDLYRGFFGHIYYKKTPLLRDISRAFAKYLVKKPQPQLASFAWLVLREPLHPPTA